ncbi:MAG: hydrogenase expression/formation protein HypE, partial [Anaerolineae bacterium]|nr:hydrogenase expression/formation protein HypE [Anaerolineae bacterium]
AHGSGGKLHHELVRGLFLRHFRSPVLASLDDAAAVAAPGTRLAFTTDSYVISPLFFPGGDIGKLAVCGTVNDLAVVGARPLYLSAGFILEEGLPLETLERVVTSMAETARAAGVDIVTGDTKVVDRGSADGLFVNTAGVGALPEGLHLTPRNLRPGDVLLVSGTIGDHGMAVMMQREGLSFQSALVSDCAPLNGLIQRLLSACPGAVRCMRDPTRGGLATTLNEWTQAAAVGIEVDEEAIPLREEVRAACEFLGLDPLYVANEGKVVVAVAPEAADAALEALRAHPLGRDAARIGQVTEAHPHRVVLRTPLGARRVVEMLAGAQLPRIC